MSAGTQASSRKSQEQEVNESFYKQQENFLKEKTAAERREFSMYNIYKMNCHGRCESVGNKKGLQQDP